MSTNKYLIPDYQTSTEEDIKTKAEEPNYASLLKRGISATIDAIIVMSIRIAIIQIFWIIIGINLATKFILEFKEKFGAESIRSKDHLVFLMNHNFFIFIILMALIFFAVGLVYYSFFNSSKWQATIGKKIMGIKIIRIDNKKITLLFALFYYILSLLPFLFPLYFLTYESFNRINKINVNFFDNFFNVILAILSVVWIQISILNKKKLTVSDMICKIINVKA
ncbi:MAG: RDD family protein [Rickettsiales bacterium]|nr:RDD family protein [Rickettsiales bacterium]